jgi:hypothetical protein
MPNFTFDIFNFERDTGETDTLLKLDTLKKYDVIVLFENGVSSKSIFVGTRIKSYVMAGGNLILATFYCQGRSDGGYGSSYGQLETIDPVYHYVDTYTQDTLKLSLNNGTVANHPLLLGIDSLFSKYGGGNDSLRSDATLIARWSNNQILAAYNKPAGRILYIGLFPPELDYTTSTRNTANFFNIFWSRAIRYAYNATVSSTDYQQNLTKIQLVNHSARFNKTSGAIIQPEMK